MLSCLLLWIRPIWALVLLFTVASATAQIRIGQTAGFTGTAAAGVKEAANGARLYIDAVNAKGGVHGQQIELLSLDDKFDPALAAENARILVEEKNVSALFLTRGTPHTQGIIPVLKKNAVALIAPSTGAMVLHQPIQRYVFNVRTTYQREAEKSVGQLQTMGISRIGILAADDSFGADALAGAQKGFAGAKLEPKFIVRFDRVKPDFAAIAARVAKSDVQSVLFLGTTATTADGIKAIRAAGSAAQIVTLSNNASGGFIKSLGDHARGVIVTQTLPNERSINYAFVKEAQELSQQKGAAALTPAMLEGFVGAKVLVEGLRRAGKDATRERVLAALEGMRNFDIGGLEIGYAANDHTGLDFVDLSIINQNGRFAR